MNPVSRIEVPDYYTTVTNPMHWLGIYAKIEQHEYLDSQTFVVRHHSHCIYISDNLFYEQNDVNLVLDNAIGYNKKDSVYHKAALRIKNNVQPVLAQFQAAVQEKTALWKANEPWGDDEATNGALDAHVPTDTQVAQPIATGPADTQNTEVTDITDITEIAKNNSTNDVTLPSLDGGENSTNPPNSSTGLPPEEEVIPATPNQDLAEKPDLLVDNPQASNDHQPTIPPVGDMEPFPPLLRMLQDQAGASEDLDYILTTDPLTSFFTYERPILKPPPPPPPPPPPKQPRKPKRKSTVVDATAGPSARGGASSTRVTRGTAARTEPLSPQHPHPQRVVLLVREPAQAQVNEGDAQQQLETDTEPASASTPTARASAKRKRQDSENNWGQVVTDVNPQESFKVSISR
jgi:hypothetical protein